MKSEEEKMPTTSIGINARSASVDAPNRTVDVAGRNLAYRSIGTGTPLVLGTRFRGNMDKWDPAFLDALVNSGFRVITFDHSGLGLSTGRATYSPIEMAADFRDLIAALNLKDVVIAGWSLGGLVAQSALALYPNDITHLVLIGSGPPGKLVKTAEPLFYEIAGKEINDENDNAILFFEPASAASRTASALSLQRMAMRTHGLSAEVSIDFARAALGTEPKNPIFPAGPILEALKKTTVPILHVGGDHDISFPIENWYALSQQLKTLQLVTFPQTGHGPQHQHPQMAADAIASFVRNT
jgi:pimeloyl-ACP methyl ester carboxylesterase